MWWFDGSLARQLEFGDIPGNPSRIQSRLRLRVVPDLRGVRGPDKYKMLEHRRRQAQIRARRLLESLDSSSKHGARNTS
ncbi:MAG TPA: hypothetical protein VH740_03985 [Vicinamibacterales bacterium]|jgi:hypothetical protein